MTASSSAPCFWSGWVSATEMGIGNGTSIIIFGGIVPTLPTASGKLFGESTSRDIIAIVTAVRGHCLITVVGIVLVNEGQRRIPVQQHAKSGIRGKPPAAAQPPLFRSGSIPGRHDSAHLCRPDQWSSWKHSRTSSFHLPRRRAVGRQGLSTFFNPQSFQC